MFCLGLRKLSEEERIEQQDAVMRSKYFDPIENFPDRIDQLLAAINRVCHYSFCQLFECFILDLCQSEKGRSKIQRYFYLILIYA